jgi:outer membrane protein assembly factor BamB
MMTRAFLAGFALAFASPLAAADWPQWMGPGRDGVWPETGIVEKLPATGPAVLWRAPVGLGYAGPAVVGGRVFVFDYQKSGGAIKNDPGGRGKLQGQERLLCLNAQTGKELWKHAYDRTYAISYPSGPRCTPTVADGKVYALGAEGNLTCLDLEGNVLWAKELTKEYKCETPIWGFCGHPLVDRGTLYLVVGGKGSVAVALDAATGKEKWRALSASAPGYSAPSIIESAGARQLLIWDADKLSSLDPATGMVYWSQPLKPAYEMAIMMPRQAGDRLFASAIGNVAALYKLGSDKPSAEPVWEGGAKRALYAANATPLVDGDTLYGADCDSGMLIAVDLKDGNRLWSTAEPTTGKRRAGHGTTFLVRNGERYFLFSETGDLIIAKLTPEAYEEISRAHLVDATGEAFGREVVWSHPAFANKCCYVRNDREIVCVDLAKKP